MDDQRTIRESSSGIDDRELRFTLSAAFSIALFAIIHFIAGFVLIFAWVRFQSWQIVDTLGRILINIWWFPGQQIYQLYHSDYWIPRLVFPVCNSLLWGAVAFLIWRAGHGQYCRFSLRSLLIAMTLIAVALGVMDYLARN